MNVELLGYTPNPDFLTGMAAMLTHSEAKTETLCKEDTTKVKDLLDFVIQLGHTSVVEHASFTFSISGVSRALTHQLVRHRIASYSQQSQRYVTLKYPQYIIPPSIAKHAEARRQYSRMIQNIWDLYESLRLKGIPLEDARYILPNATYSNIIVSMNARSLHNFFDLRCCLFAQWEIRVLAYKMLRLVRDVAPTIFANAGPPCKTRKECPLKKKTCKWYPE